MNCLLVLPFFNANYSLYVVKSDTLYLICSCDNSNVSKKCRLKSDILFYNYLILIILIAN